MNIFGRAASDYLLVFLLWIWGVFVTLVALGFPAEARAVPLLVGIPLIVLTSLDLLAMTNIKAAAWLRRLDPIAAPSQEVGVKRATFGKQVKAWAFVIGFVVLFILINPLTAVAVYIAASMRVLGKYRLLTSLSAGLVVTAFAYAVFERLLHIDLHTGAFLALP